MTTTSDLRKQLELELPEWLERRKNDIAEALSDIRNVFSGNSTGNSIPSYFGNIYYYFMNEYVWKRLNGGDDIEALAIATQCFIRQFLCKAGRRRYDPERTSEIMRIAPFSFLLMQTITVGWREEAELVARIGLEGVETVLSNGISSSRLAWFTLELAKDWLGTDTELMTKYRQAHDPGLGIWRKALEQWRTTDQKAFGKLMEELAEHHVQQSHYLVVEGADHDPDQKVFQYEIDDSIYWLFPVELLALLRLREWEGLPNPPMTHPLFSTSSLAVLQHPALEQVHDPELDKALEFYSAKYPRVPTLAELPELRRKQSRQH